MVGATEIKNSLHTHIARDRHRATAADTDAEWASLEAAAQPAAATNSAPPALPQRQVAAIAGAVYSLIGEASANDPGDPAFWARKVSEGVPATAESAALNQGAD